MENTFYELPGIKAEIDIFKTCLKIAGKNHILIRGPAGVGKGIFLQIFKELSPATPIIRTCISILHCQLPPIIIQAAKEGAPLILEDLDHLSEEDMRSLFGALRSTQVIATSSDTSDKIPAYLLEEFEIVVDVPPLHQRRMDIFHFIAIKYPYLRLYPSELLTLFSYNWPSNLRQLDHALTNLLGGSNVDKLETGFFWQLWMDITHALNDAGLTSDKLEQINNECFGGIIPFNYSELFGERIKGNRFCTVSFDDTGFPVITCVNEEKKTSTDIDCTEIKIFFSDVFGRTALSRDIPIFHNDIFQEHTGFVEVPPVSESDIYYCPGTASQERLPLSESEQARSDLLWEFTLACNKVHASLAEVRLQNKDLSEDLPRTISQSPPQDSPADSGQENDHGLKGEYSYQQPTHQEEEPDIDIIGKVNIKIQCGYDHSKKNWTSIERHCDALKIIIRHVNDNSHSDPILKKSDCNLICARKLASDKKKAKKVATK